MNNKEKQLIQKAINLLCEDKWENGMEILKKLINPKWVSSIDNLHNVDLKVINYRDLDPFRVSK
jgi:hypothetical protein